LKDQKRYSWESYIENCRQIHLHKLEDLPLGQFKIQRDLGSWGKLCLEIQNSAKGAVFNFEGTELQSELSLTSPMTSGVCLAALNAFFRIQQPISIGHFQNLTVQAPMRSALDGKISNLTPMGPLILANILANTIVELLARSVKSLSVGEPGFSLAVSCIFEDGQVLFDSMPGGSGGSHQVPGQDGIDVWTRLGLHQSIEEMEKHFPVTVERHEKRAHSGGRGHFPGGDGLRRTIKFKKPARVSWLPAMTKLKADGFLGGSQGDACMLTLVRANGEESQDLPSDFEIQIGDRLTLLSGGGGGFGRAEN
jgi:N-methylhydantoinase B/oxoprolinase/acetone carboxylase alpha subunit